MSLERNPVSLDNSSLVKDLVLYMNNKYNYKYLEFLFKPNEGFPMTIIGAMIGTDGIFIFSDQLIMENITNGRCKKLEEKYTIIKEKNMALLYAGDKQLFDDFMPYLEYHKFNDKGRKNTSKLLHKNFKYHSSDDDLGIQYGFVNSRRLKVILAGFDNEKATIHVIGLEPDPYFYPIDLSKTGYYIYSPIINDYKIKIEEFFKLDKTCAELEIFAREVFDYNIDNTAQVGGEFRSNILSLTNNP